MEQKDKNKWIDNVMNSLDGIQKAEPGAFAFGMVESRIKDGSVITVKGRLIPLKWVSAVAASILLLIGINIFFIVSKVEVASNDPVRSVATYYGLTNDNLIDGL